MSAFGGYSVAAQRAANGQIDAVLEDLADFEARESLRIGAEPQLTEVR